METNLIAEAAKFMLLGMGIVFLFLIIMILVLKVQAKIIGKYFPEKKVSPVKATKASDNTAKMAAIVAAVQHHKNLKG
ncbi:MAG: OadG family transporter subunit [Halarcobacter sp.]